MIRIYGKEEKDFISLGLGSLNEAVSAVVVEEINGRYEMEMEYPISGRHFQHIQLRNIIFCKPNMDTDPQPFRIYSITKPIDGIVTINAEHISYDMTGLTILPKRNEEGSVISYGTKPEPTEQDPEPDYILSTILSDIKNHSIITGKNNFTLQIEDGNTITKKDIIDEKKYDGSYKIPQPMNMRSIIGGSEGSLLDFYEGEWRFDKYNLYLNSKRGIDRGITIRYGKNMTDLEQETDSSNQFTGVFPFYSKSYTETVTKTGLTFQEVYVREGVRPFRHEWLSLSDPNTGSNIELIPLIESSWIRVETIIDGLTTYVSKLVAVKVKTPGDYYNKLYVYNKNTPKENLSDPDNLVEVYISDSTNPGMEDEKIKEIISKDDYDNQGLVTVITGKYGDIYTVRGRYDSINNEIDPTTIYLNKNIIDDRDNSSQQPIIHNYVMYTSEGFYKEVYDWDSLPLPEEGQPPYPDPYEAPDGKIYVKGRKPGTSTESVERYVYLDIKNYDDSEDGVELPFIFDKDEGIIYVDQESKDVESQRLLTLDLTSELDDIVNTDPTQLTQKMLFNRAEQYLVENNLKKIKESVTVSFVKLSDSPEYSHLKQLEVVQLGDEVSVIYEKLGVTAKHRVISTEYNVLTNAYNEIELGDKTADISANLVTTGDPVSSLKNDMDYTDKSYVAKLIAETAEITNAYIENAFVTYLQAGSASFRGTVEVVNGSIFIQGDGGKVFEVNSQGEVTATNLTLTGGEINFNNGNFKVTESGIVTAKQISIDKADIEEANIDKITGVSEIEVGKIYLGEKSDIYNKNIILEIIKTSGETQEQITENQTISVSGYVISQLIGMGESYNTEITTSVVLDKPTWKNQVVTVTYKYRDLNSQLTRFESIDVTIPAGESTGNNSMIISGRGNVVNPLNPDIYPNVIYETRVIYESGPSVEHINLVVTIEGVTYHLAGIGGSNPDRGNKIISSDEQPSSELLEFGDVWFHYD